MSAPHFAQMFHDPAGSWDELKAQFSGHGMKRLLRSQIERDLAHLEQRVQAFTKQLSDLIPMAGTNETGQFRSSAVLLNYDDWRIVGNPQHTQFLDYQVVNSSVEGERDHLRVGDHFVRVLTMKEAVAETRPMTLDTLLKIPANFMACMEWTQLPADKARKEVNKRRRHFNIAKTGFVSQLGNDPGKSKSARCIGG